MGLCFHSLESYIRSIFIKHHEEMKSVFAPSCYSCHVTLVVDFVSSPLFSEAHLDHSSCYSLSSHSPRLSIHHTPLFRNDCNYTWTHSCAHNLYLLFAKIYVQDFTFRRAFQNVFSKNVNTYLSLHSLTVHSQ